MSNKPDVKLLKFCKPDPNLYMQVFAALAPNYQNPSFPSYASFVGLTPNDIFGLIFF